MEQFLNPKSMITPGIAGGIAMLLANTICLMFPEIPFRYAALTLSFIIGFGTVATLGGQLATRVVYWVMNSLIIFSMGVGTSNIGANLTDEPADRAHAAQAAGAGQPNAWSFLVGEAYAQDDNDGARDSQRQKFFRRW